MGNQSSLSFTAWNNSTELDTASQKVPDRSPFWMITAVEIPPRARRKKDVSKGKKQQNGLLDAFLDGELNDEQPLKTKWIAKLLFDEA